MSELVDALMAQVLAQMSVISEVKAYDYDSVRVVGGDKNGMPSLAEKPMIDFYWERYRNARSPRTKRLIVLEAAQALQLARVMPIPKGQEPAYGSAEWKRYVFESKEDAGVLAARFHVTRRYINMVRRAEGIITRQQADAEARLDAQRRENVA